MRVGGGAGGVGQDKVVHGQAEVGRSEGADLPVALHQLVQLQTHQASHCRCGSRYGRDDPPSDALTLDKRGREKERERERSIEREGG